MTEHQNWACRLVQLSHFNLSFLMTTSYLLAYYTLDIQVSLSFSIIIKTDLFYFLSFCWIITPICRIRYKSFLCYGKLKKKSGEIMSNLRKIYSNNHENFKNTKSKSRLKLLALKECTNNVHYYRLHYYSQSSWILQCNGFRKWL